MEPVTLRTDRLVLSPPEHIAYFDPSTGVRVLEEERAPAPPLGSEPFDIPRSEYPRLSAELYAAYDTLLPAFVLREAPVRPEVRSAAISFKRLFPRFSGKLLRPYYEQIGGEWFAWIDRVADGSEGGQ